MPPLYGGIFDQYVCELIFILWRSLLQHVALDDLNEADDDPRAAAGILYQQQHHKAAEAEEPAPSHRLPKTCRWFHAWAAEEEYRDDPMKRVAHDRHAPRAARRLSRGHDRPQRLANETPARQQRQQQAKWHTSSAREYVRCVYPWISACMEPQSKSTGALTLSIQFTDK